MYGLVAGTVIALAVAIYTLVRMARLTRDTNVIAQVLEYVVGDDTTAVHAPRAQQRQQLPRQYPAASSRPPLPPPRQQVPVRELSPLQETAAVQIGESDRRGAPARRTKRLHDHPSTPRVSVVESAAVGSPMPPQSTPELAAAASPPEPDAVELPPDEGVDVYDMQGRLIRRVTHRNSAGR
mgnify:CR=1 FL=1